LGQTLWKGAELVLSLLALGYAASRPGIAAPVWAWSIPVLALLLDRGRTPFPFYGSLSAGPAMILFAASGDILSPTMAAGALLALFLLRGRMGEADILPASLTLAALLAAPALKPLAGGLYLILAVLHPLARSVAFPQLPGAMIYRSVPFLAAEGAIICSGPWMSGPAGLALQTVLLACLVGLARGQRGLSLETAFQQENQRLQAEQLKDWLRLLDALGYTLHEQAEPGKLLHEVGQAMIGLSSADTFAIAERRAQIWQVAESSGLPADQVAGWLTRDLPRGSKSRIALTKGWAGERHAVLIPWQDEAGVYLGRRDRALESLPLIERLGRLGAAALRTARAKAKTESLRQRGEHLKAWVDDLTSLLREIHFVGSTLEREDLLARLKATLGRTLRPDVAFLYSAQGVEKAWGAQPAEAPERPAARPNSQAESIAPPPGFATALLAGLGANGSLLLLYRQEPASLTNILAYLGVLSDVVGTFLSNSELFIELRETHQRLETSQGELVQAKKLAAVGQLAAGVAHEINNPLLAMSVHLDLVKGSLSDPEDIDSADTIAQAIERCRVIVAQLLAFSRQPNTAPQKLSVGDLCRQALKEANMSLPVAPEANAFQVSGYRHELVGLLVNLLTNARDAAGGEQGVRLSVQGLDSAVEIRVEDRGPGVPAALADRIFEPFFTTKPVGSGTGLGLYLAYTYATHAGGELKLSSTSPEGSTFSVCLPLVANPDAA
jgi:signal transduction histidine kinase